MEVQHQMLKHAMKGKRKLKRTGKKKKRGIRRKRPLLLRKRKRAVKRKRFKGRIRRKKRRVNVQRSVEPEAPSSRAFTYMLGIGFVNRADLLHNALRSVEPYWSHSIVIDNSKNSELSSDSVAASVEVLHPPVPYSFSQTMNVMHRLGAERKREVIMFLHNDAEVRPGTMERFLHRIGTLLHEERRWGAVLTQYQSLVAFNMAAVREVGPWDIQLPQYFSDNDYYRRLRLAGYEIVETELDVLHVDGGSGTIKADAELRSANDILHPLHGSYYSSKWGGLPGSEQLDRMFGGYPLNPVNDYLSEL
jgi:hypothetical protein